MTEPNILENKKIICIGDSMVQGNTLSDADGQTWLAKIAGRNHMRHKNYGRNGASLSYNDVYNGELTKEDSVIGRYQSMDDDADYILVYAGTNDVTNEIPLGERNDTDPSTFRGALHVLCHGLLQKYPDKKIGFITPYAAPNTYTNWANAPLYVDEIISICADYHIPVFNNRTDGEINWADPVDLEKYTQHDLTHLSEEGMEYVSHRYEQFLRSI